MWILCHVLCSKYITLQFDVQILNYVIYDTKSNFYDEQTPVNDVFVFIRADLFLDHKIM